MAVAAAVGAEGGGPALLQCRARACGAADGLKSALLVARATRMVSVGTAELGLPMKPPTDRPGTPKSGAGPDAPHDSVGVAGRKTAAKKSAPAQRRPGQQQQQQHPHRNTGALFGSATNDVEAAGATSAARSSVGLRSIEGVDSVGLVTMEGEPGTELDDVKELQEAERLLAVKHQKYRRQCAQNPPEPERRAEHSSLVAAIWDDFAHVMRDPPDTEAEEAALVRHRGNAAQLGDGPLWWNSVAAQNHAAQMRSSWVKDELSTVHGPGGGPGRTGNAGLRGKAFQRETFDLSLHSWKHEDSRKVKGRHKKRDVRALQGHGTLTGDALQSYLSELCDVRDSYCAAQEELLHKAAQVTPMRQLRAAGTSHEREFSASTHYHDDLSSAVKNAMTRTSSIAGGALFGGEGGRGDHGGCQSLRRALTVLSSSLAQGLQINSSRTCKQCVHPNACDQNTSTRHCQSSQTRTPVQRLLPVLAVLLRRTVGVATRRLTWDRLCISLALRWDLIGCDCRHRGYSARMPALE